jgi:hypothetical protein
MAATIPQIFNIVRYHQNSTYEMALKSDNVEFVRYCGGHFENGWPVEIFQCRESIRDIIIYPHINRTNSTLSDFKAISYVGRLWCPKLIPDIEKFLPVAIFKMATTIPHKFNIVILKMATGRNFSMSGINSGHHYLPTYQIFMISDNVEFLQPIFYATNCVILFVAFWYFIIDP